MNPQLLAILLQQLPSAIVAIKGAFTSAHPGAPEPTDAEIIATLTALLNSSLVKDAEWLSAHPG